MVEDMELDRAETVVELGAGTGSFTKAIERNLRPEALFLALEVNSEFAAGLQTTVSQAKVINDSAENLGALLRGFDRDYADSIVCGLPWASFPGVLQDRIMQAVVSALRPGGRFATFAYIHAAWFPTARRFHGWLQSHFPEVKKTRIEWKNLPPAFVYRCEK